LRSRFARFFCAMFAGTDVAANSAANLAEYTMKNNGRVRPRL